MCWLKNFFFFFWCRNRSHRQHFDQISELNKLYKRDRGRKEKESSWIKKKKNYFAYQMTSRKPKLELINDNAIEAILLISFINGPSIYPDENKIKRARALNTDVFFLSLSLHHSLAPKQKQNSKQRNKSNFVEFTNIEIDRIDKNNEWLTLQSANRMNIKTSRSLF